MSLERPCIHWSDGYCNKFSDGEFESWCVDGPCKYEQPSNADRIRAMSDEELAKLIVDNHPMKAWNKEVRHIFFDGPRITHKEAWLRWLKQPAE